MERPDTPADELHDRPAARPLAESDPRQIPADEWRWTQRHLPIACLDFLPIRLEAGRLVAFGLIMRDSPQGPGWSLIGGRIVRNESADEAAVRHLAHNLGPDARFRPRDWDEPDFICQYFTEPRPGFPLDTRQHAISLTYLVELEGPIVSTNQAHEFRWFAIDEPTPAMSFGQEAFLDRLVGIARRHHPAR